MLSLLWWGSIGPPPDRRCTAVPAPEGVVRYHHHAGGANPRPRRHRLAQRSLHRLVSERAGLHKPPLPALPRYPQHRISPGAASTFIYTPRPPSTTSRLESVSSMSCIARKNGVWTPSP